jgi:NADH-quinone oxidoreductase subunit N
MQIPFIPNWPDLRPFTAELWLIVTIVCVLLTPFFVRKPNSACGLVALLGLGIAFCSLLAVGNQGGSPADPGRFGSMLATDGVAFLWTALLLLFTAGIVLMWFATTMPTMREGDGPEFFTLLLGATLGMALMGSASNLLMVFMTVEAASLPSYVLAGFRKTNRAGAEASLKYVLFGAAASAIMVYGLSLFYGLFGTLLLYPSADGPGLARMLAQGSSHGGGVGPLLVVAVLGLVCGLGFKIAAVPFHFWCPDVFEGASIDVTAFLSVASKGAGLVLLMRFAVAIADAAGYEATGITTALAAVIGTLGAITCTVGNTAAYVQNNMKRLLAYSSIAHAGYMLCAVSLLVRHGRQMASPGDSATAAILFYLAVYLFMNLGAFTIAGVIARGGSRAGETDPDSLSSFAGLGRRDPLLAGCMTACLFSLIGLPPLAGFTAKFNILAVLVANGGAWWVLVAVVSVNTVLSVYYYARIVKAMYFQADVPADAAHAVPAAAFAGYPLGRGLSLTCAVVLVGLFVGASPLANLTIICGRFHGTGTPTAVAHDTSPLSPAGVAKRPTMVAAGR